MSELQADADQALSEKYSNFTLSDKINLSLPENYMECDFVQTDGFTSRADELVSRFFDAEQLGGIKTEQNSWDYSEAFSHRTSGFSDEEKEMMSSVQYNYTEGNIFILE